MKRLTKKVGTKYSVENIDVAVERLGKLEDTLDFVEAQQILLSEQLEILRNEGDKSSTKFRELMGKKLTNKMILAAFEDVE